MDSMDRKIRNFLQEAGYTCGAQTSSHLQLLRFFEAEYDAEIMGLLEQEWFEEQIERDLSSDDFWTIRTAIDEAYLPEYDQVVRSLLGR